MEENKLSMDLRHCMDGECEACAQYKTATFLTCQSLVQEAYRRIKYHEELEEKGKTVRFPCVPGDILYRINTDEMHPCADIETYKVDNIVICGNGEILFKYNPYDGIICNAENITSGSRYLDIYRVFLTRKEAEEALEQTIKSAKQSLIHLNECRAFAAGERFTPARD